MSASDLAFIKALLLEALQLPPAERETFVRAHPTATPHQREQALALLAAHSNSPLDHTLPDRLPSLAPLLSPGDTVSDRYQVVEALALTTNSQVYLAIDLRLAENQVVLKFPTFPTENFSALQDHLWREISALARLQHPSVTGLIDTGLHLGLPFLVTRYHSGPTLGLWLEEHRPSPEARLALFFQLLNIVETIHDAGLLHLDLKPDNILVHHQPGETPAITVLDFGIASLRESPTTHRAGTPSYAAPERVSGQASAASDIYSLARIGYDLLPHLAAVFSSALADSPAARPASVSALRLQLHHALRRRRQIRLLTRAALPSAALVALFAFIWFYRRPPQLPSTPTFRTLTSLRGQESQPAFSIDGQTVYFSHGPSESVSTSLYSVPFAGGLPQLVLQAPAGSRFSDPALAPDGRHIAYLDDKGSGNISIIYAALDKSSSRSLYQGRTQSVCFHPSGAILYFNHQSETLTRGQIHLHNLATQTTTALEPPPAGYSGDLDLAVSPDGRFLSFARYRTLESADLYLLPLDTNGLPSGSPFKITSLDRRLHRPQWLPDSRTIYFTAGSLTSLSLYRATLASNPRDAASIEHLPSWGNSIRLPATARQSNRLILVQDREDCDIYRLSLTNPNRLERFLSSTALDEEPRFSADGRSIAFFSERSGQLQGWIAPRDNPAQPRQITSFDRAEKAWPGWDSAGAAVFFARLPQVGPELHRFSPGQPLQRVFSADRTQRVAGIGADGQSLLMELTSPTAPRLERWHIYNNLKEVLSHTQARFAREFFTNGPNSPRIILYSDNHEANGLFLIEGGRPPRKIYPSLARRNTFAYHNGYAYFASHYPTTGIYQLDLKTLTPRLLHALDRNPGWGLDVSPDGKDLLVALYDFEDSNLIATELP